MTARAWSFVQMHSAVVFVCNVYILFCLRVWTIALINGVELLSITIFRGNEGDDLKNVCSGNVFLFLRNILKAL